MAHSFGPPPKSDFELSPSRREIELFRENGFLVGRFLSDIRTEDANRRPYSLLLTLKPRGAVLNGPVSAISLPGKRAGNALTSWAELRR